MFYVILNDVKIEEFMNNIFDLLLRSHVKEIPCSGFGCKNLVPVDNRDALPDYVICQKCENRINEGIVFSVHAHTSKTQGSYNIFDEMIH